MAWNVEKNCAATFALSRFRRVEGTGEAFTRPVTFNPETYARQGRWSTGGVLLRYLARGL